MVVEQCFFHGGRTKGALRKKVPYSLVKQNIGDLGLNSYSMANNQRYRGAIFALDKKEDVEENPLN